MKITQVKLGRISTPLRVPFKTALRTVSSVEDVIVELHTDTGAVGYGEAPPTGVITGDTTGAIIGAIRDHIAPAILGRNLDEFEDLTAAVQKALVHNTSAKAALDQAQPHRMGHALPRPGGDACRIAVKAQGALRHIAALILGVAVEKDGQLLPGDGAVGIEASLVVACGDALPLGPGRRRLIPGPGGHVREGGFHRKRRCALQPPQYGHHGGAGHRRVGAERSLAGTGHISRQRHRLHRLGIPGVRGDVAVGGNGGGRGACSRGRQSQRRAQAGGAGQGGEAFFHGDTSLSSWSASHCTTWILKICEQALNPTKF